MTDTQYLINLAPDFSVLKLAEKYLYCDSNAAWDSDGMIVDKLFFAINRTDEIEKTYEIPFKRILLKTENNNFSDLAENYIVKLLHRENDDNIYVIISPENTISLCTDVSIVGVGF